MGHVAIIPDSLTSLDGHGSPAASQGPPAGGQAGQQRPDSPALRRQLWTPGDGPATHQQVDIENCIFVIIFD